MAARLVVNVAELFRALGTVKDFSAVADADDLAFDDDRMAERPVTVRLRLESASEGIVATGVAEAQWNDLCRRCLRPVGGLISAEIDDVFLHESTDPDAWLITEAHIDLAPMVREALLLGLPGAPLCRPDCPGLCATCGADLADGSCGCTPAEADDRWSALDALRGRLSDEPAD